MAETYFTNFNIINYANNQAVDLTERVVVIKNLEKNPYIYYPTDITSGIRPDQITNVVYDDPYTSWLLYLSNDIIDPYYEWYLNDHQFNEFITKKYGSVEKAQQKIARYINNWFDQSSINEAAFEALSSGRKKYWEPTYDNNGRINSYQRKKENWKSSTNYVINIFTVSAGSFIEDEVVNIHYAKQDETITSGLITTGKAQVAFANSSCVTIKHCSGDFLPSADDLIINSKSYITGTESNSNCLISSCKLVNFNIPIDEYIYWQEQSFYDLEQEKNEGNRTIRIMQTEYVPGFIRNIKELLGQ